MTVKEILELAARLLETRGWAQEHYSDVQGRVCLMGAVGHALGIEPVLLQQGEGWEERFLEKLEVRPALLRALVEITNTSPEGLDADGVIGRVTNFNDKKGRTADDVIVSLRRVAEAHAATSADPVSDGAR